MKPVFRTVLFLCLSFIIGYYGMRFFKNRNSTEMNLSGINDLNLTDQSGQNINLLKSPVKIKIIYFGFTHCPAVCPGTLANFTAIMKSDRKFTKEADFYFITVDPLRDTPSVLKEYLDKFDSRIIGLTGTREDIEKARSAFRAEAKTVRQGNGDYTVDHSLFIYILGKDNRVKAVYPSGTDFLTLTKEIGRFL